MAENQNKSLIDRRIFDRVWEDTAILALRDLQWRKRVEQWAATCSTAIESGELCPPAPAPNALLKLDGNAETAIGDAITSVENDRFFIFEFKSSSGAGGSEYHKPLVSTMKRVATLPDDHSGRALFEKATKAAHHFVFPEFKADALVDAAPVPTQRATVVTAGYYEAAKAMTSTTFTLTRQEDLVSMLFADEHKETYGLPAVEMAAYLLFLTNAYEHWVLEQPKKDKGDDVQDETDEGSDGSGDAAEGGDSAVNVPLKALIFSDSGFFWPCADMKDLAQIYIVLGGHPDVDVQAYLKKSNYPSLPLTRAADEPPAPGAKKTRAGFGARSRRT